MKKAVSILSVAVASGVLLVPKFVGDAFEKKLSQQVEALNALPGYSVELVSYQKNWFSSDGVAKVKFEVPSIQAGETVPPEFEFETEFSVDHGPVTFSNGFGFNRISWQQSIVNVSELEELSLDQPVYSNNGQLSLFGDLSFKEVIPALDIPDGETTIKFSGYQSAAVTDNDGLLQYQGKAGSVAIEGGARKAAISDITVGMTLDFDLNKILSHQLYNGSVEMNVGSVDIDSVFNARNLNISSLLKASADASKGDITLHYGVESVKADDFDLKDVSFDMTLLNYSSAFNKAYNTELVKLMNHDSSFDPELLNKALVDSLPLLLAGKPEFKIDKIHFSLPEGSFDSNLSLKLSEYDLQPAQLYSSAYWTNNIQLDASASADTRLVEKLIALFMSQKIAYEHGVSDEEARQIASQQTQMMLGIFAAQGMIKQANDKYTMNFSMINGEANLNGRPLPLPAI